MMRDTFILVATVFALSACGSREEPPKIKTTAAAKKAQPVRQRTSDPRLYQEARLSRQLRSQAGMTAPEVSYSRIGETSAERARHRLDDVLAVRREEFRRKRAAAVGQ